MRHLLIAAALLGSLTAVNAAPAAPRNEALPAATAQQLDQMPAEFTASDAKLRRMQIIQHNMDRQRYGRGGGHGYGRGYGYSRGYGGGYGYGRRHGGPPPWAPAHGYRRHGYYDRW